MKTSENNGDDINRSTESKSDERHGNTIEQNDTVKEMKNAMALFAKQFEQQQRGISEQMKHLQIRFEQQILNHQPGEENPIKNSRSNGDSEINGQVNAPNEIRVTTSHNNRVHHDIAQRFKSKESKYAGNDEEDIPEFFSIYEITAEDYEMSQEQKLRYVHNIFKDEALRFYNINLRNQAKPYDEVKRLMTLHFNSPDVQSRVKNELQTLEFQ